MNNLKLCPFCGSKPDYHSWEECSREIDAETRDMITYRVEVVECCGISMQPEQWNFRADSPIDELTRLGQEMGDYDVELIEKWNTRADGWISVDDQMPEENENGMSDVVIARYTDGRIRDHYTYKERWFRPARDVIAWMPIPKLPWEEEEC